MICPRCGDLNSEGVSFCKTCREPLTGFQGDGSQSVYYPRVQDSQDVPYPPAESYPQPYPPSYQQPVYGSPQFPVKSGNPKKNGLAIAGFVLSIVCLPMFFCFTFAAVLGPNTVTTVMTIGIIINITTIVMSILGVSSQRKGFAIAGIILGAIGLLLAAYTMYGIILLLQSGELQEILDDAGLFFLNR